MISVSLILITILHCAAQEILLVSQKTELMMMALQTRNYSVDKLDLDNFNRVLDIDYDPTEGWVYWSDIFDNVIRRALLDGTAQECVVRTGLSLVAGIAVDWIQRKLYWTDSVLNKIEVSNLDGTSRNILISSGLKEPRAICIDMEQRFVYWTDWGKTPTTIERFNLDTNERAVLVNMSVGWPNDLDIDTKQGKMYWVNEKKDVIEVSNLDGSDRRTLIRGNLQGTYSLSLCGDYVYFVNNWKPIIERAKKLDGSEREIMIRNKKFIVGIKATKVHEDYKIVKYLTGHQGNFSSPDIEISQPLHVRWTIHVRDGRIELSFDKYFSLVTKDTKCNKTFIRVFDGNTTGDNFLRLNHCGNNPPNKIVSSSNVLLVEFRAQNMTYGEGFTARYRHIKDLEFKIHRIKETWMNALQKCRFQSSYLSKPINLDIKFLRQHIAINEEVWVGTYNSPWMWMKECWEYQPSRTDKIIYIVDNSVSRCQTKCQTDQVWLQNSTCLCTQSIFHKASLVRYKRCNILCKGDEKDICGGGGVFMRYQKWYQNVPRLNGIANAGQCIVLSFSDHIWNWNEVSCNERYKTICKDNEVMNQVGRTNEFSALETSDPSFLRSYETSLRACLSDQRMNPDLPNDTSVLNKVKLKMNDSPKGIWVGLRRGTLSVSNNTVDVPLEKMTKFCHYIVLNENGELLKYTGNCLHKRSYYCMKSYSKTKQSDPSTIHNVTVPGKTTSENPVWMIPVSVSVVIGSVFVALTVLMICIRRRKKMRRNLQMDINYGTATVSNDEHFQNFEMSEVGESRAAMQVAVNRRNSNNTSGCCIVI